MKLTFLSGAGVRLAKTFSNSEVSSYPHVKRVTSFEEEGIETIEDMADAITRHAEQGNCLLKGHTIRPLINESRKGQVDRNEPTGFLALDFDGVRPDDSFVMPETYDEAALVSIAEYVISELPEVFHGVSYIAQASSSFGRKTETISLHLFFLLDRPVHPGGLKTFITDLNFYSKFWEQQLKLSATGSALSFPIDRTICDNGRLIYIAPPRYSGTADDPCGNWNRITSVYRDSGTLELGEAIGKSSPERTASRIKKRIKELRNVAGLKARREVTRTMRVGDNNVFYAVP